MQLPTVPEHHRGRRWPTTRWIARTVLHASGWKVEGEVPDHPRLILVVGPHTSNWDFVYGMMAILATNLDIHWLGKNSLFKPPVTGLMSWLGGIPVNRANPKGVVEDIADKFRQADSLSVIITPEGTRSRVERIKTGFLRIAESADCGLLITTLDFSSKTIRLGETLKRSTDMEADLERILQLFSEVTPRNPDNFSGPEN